LSACVANHSLYISVVISFICLATKRIWWNVAYG